LLTAVDQLDAYFAGELTDFDVELDMRGTEFQRRVWQALLTIPYGETRSYGEIAEQIGAPVPLAPWDWPTAITRSPSSCRVIASLAPSGKLTGYGGGLDRKQTPARIGEKPGNP